MIKVQAHRGHSEFYPENTMLAFQKAYETGCYGIEIDVRKTSDDVYVVLHDPTVDRTTNGTGLIADLPYSYVQTLDAGAWFDPSFSGRVDCKIPTLEAVLDTFKGKGVVLIFHINIYEPSDVRAILDLIVSKGMINQVHIFGEHVVINEAKIYNPNFFTLNSSGKFINNYQSDLDNAIQNNHDCVSINASNPLADLKIMVDNIHSHGKLVHISYLGNSYEILMERMIQAGADFVLGDNPEIMQNYVDALMPEQLDNFIKNGRYLKTWMGMLKLNPYTKKEGRFVKLDSYSN